MPRARLALLLLALSACHTGPTERYGFIATLGNDTVSAEQVLRSDRQLVSDEVDRFPLVKIRHTVIDLDADGKLNRMVMDIRTPSGRTPAERRRQVIADFSRSAVSVTIHDSSGVGSRKFTTNGALTVPHVSMLYSVIELEVASAMKEAAATGMKAGDSVMFRQFYPDRNIGAAFVLHRGFVHPVGNGKVELWHDWLSGVGDITVDSAERMQTYSGKRSTYKVSVQRLATPPDVEGIAARLTAAEKASGPAELSVRDTARATIGNDTIIVDYGRPLRRGRVLLGNVIDYDRIWRTGANAATQFTTSAPITLAGISLAPGTYTLWTVPHTGSVELIVNKQTKQWGTDYDRRYDLGGAPLQTASTATPVEKFTISVTRSDAKHGALVLEWGDFRWTAAIVVK